MKKLLETLFSTANSRVRNPFIGSFIFSWVIFNWKPIFYFLFSGDKVSYRISVIESNYESIANATYKPLILSLIYVILFPYVNQFIQMLTTKAEENKRVVQHKLRIEGINKEHEFAEKEKELEDIRSGNKNISQLNEKIGFLEGDNTNLKKTIQDKDEIISEYEEQLNNFKTELQEYTKKLIEEKRKNDTSLDFGLVLEYDNFRATELFDYLKSIGEAIANNEKFSLDTLIIEKYVLDDIITTYSSNNTGYIFTNKGRYFWKNYLDEFFGDKTLSL